ncbi:SMP-30/gluconolactonase/LRE family protein [Pseudarthrobacter sp. NPDC058329]|uniref:SMP-30/gluconolactonase/LRE family protein n=1 Tax=Pseudarthrobacter sp. NPDC058329 TaxID=3346448 RepID=UPI0036DAAE8E
MGGPFDAVPKIRATKIGSGYSWTEAPRWHEGAFYFSDMFNGRIMKVTEDGEATTFLDASDRVTLDGADLVTIGTGFLPDGRLLVNSMFEKVTLVWDGSTLEVYADLRELAMGPINDMVVDATGRVYVTQLGYDIFVGDEPVESDIIVIETDGRAHILESAGKVAGANGIGITADGKTLITAETNTLTTTAWDIQDDGTVSNRRLFADVPWLADGIALDADGAVWAGMPGSGFVTRVLEGGVIDSAVAIPLEEGLGVSCVLGGADRKTLFITCGLEVFDRDKSRAEGLGSIWTAPVSVGGSTVRP